MGQSSILPLDEYIKNVDPTGNSLWGGSVYWSLQNNSYQHNLSSNDGECCYPNTSKQCGDTCKDQTPFPKDGMLIPDNYFKPSSDQILHAFSTTNIINNNTKKIWKCFISSNKS